MTDSADRLSELQALKAQRKQGEIDEVAYYKGLIKILATTVQNLRDEDISPEDAKKQIPLILVFLEEQLDKMEARGV